MEADLPPPPGPCATQALVLAQVTFDLMPLVVSQKPFNLGDALSQGPAREESILSAISREIYAVWWAGHALLHFLLFH